MKSILFVCMGNICRSPALQATLETLSDEFHVESCGMGSWFLGEEADKRMRHAAHSRVIEINHKAQIFQQSFFEIFDYIFAVDQNILDELQSMAPNKSKIYLATHFSEKYKDQDIPDPYYLGNAGFEHVMDMIEDSCKGILNHISSVS